MSCHLCDRWLKMYVEREREGAGRRERERARRFRDKNHSLDLLKAAPASKCESGEKKCNALKRLYDFQPNHPDGF